MRAHWMGVAESNYGYCVSESHQLQRMAEGKAALRRHIGRRYRRVAADTKETSVQSGGVQLPLSRGKSIEQDGVIRQFPYQKFKPLPSINSPSSPLTPSLPTPVTPSPPLTPHPPTGTPTLPAHTRRRHKRTSKNTGNPDLSHTLTPHPSPLTRLPPEPSADNHNSVLLSVKLPSGDRVQRRFLTTDRLDVVMQFAVQRHCADDSDSVLEEWELSTSEVPKRSLTNLSLSLEEVGLTVKTLLHLSAP